MRLAVVTPVSTRSAIARSTDLVVAALRAQDHDVLVVRADNDLAVGVDRFDMDDGAMDWTPTPELIAELSAADAIVYELGDNAAFHAGCVKLMTTFPGIVVLHDFYLANLYNGYCHLHPGVTLDELVEGRYGPDVAAALPEVVADGRFQSFMADEAPMTEVAVEAARAAICHAHWGTERVLAACGGPVTVMPLPYDADADTDADPDMGVAVDLDGDLDLDLRDGPSETPSEKRTIVTFGHVNRNKRARSVIRALGADATVRARWRYLVVGPIDPTERAELTALADQRNVELVCRGEVTRAELASAIAGADLVSCLRYPALEASSASAIEAMLHRKPIAVTDTGFYAELPDEVVVKIDPEAEIRELHELLLSFDARAPHLAQQGERAREWALATFDPDRYAAGIVELAEQVRAQEPASAALTRIGRDLAGWGVAPDSPLLGPVLAPLDPVWS
ncbi:MAG: glycosyltransferase [Actinomycetota bacterium]